MTSLLGFLLGSAPQPNASRLRIRMSKRLVHKPNDAFASTHQDYADQATAFAELRYLPPATGATVVRVEVKGRLPADQQTLAGDWLIDPDVRERVSRLPRPRWGYSDDSMAWSRSRPWLEAWETCQNASWMLHAASEVSVDRRLIVLAACACARTALPFASPALTGSTPYNVYSSARANALANCARIVRRVIPTLTVLHAAAASAELDPSVRPQP